MGTEGWFTALEYWCLLGSTILITGLRARFQDRALAGFTEGMRGVFIGLSRCFRASIRYIRNGLVESDHCAETNRIISSFGYILAVDVAGWCG